MSRAFHTFAELYEAELAQLRAARPSPETRRAGEGSPAGAAAPDPARRLPREVTTAGSAGEPWVKLASEDHVGLALSGGGIRSAIFNLGLLQALDQRGVLRLVDYLSTVSGGSYIGGFWTAWRQRVEKAPAGGSVFPHRNATDRPPVPGEDNREEPETRHLREFSRFLVPRLGLNEPEMWFALATVLGGMLPALAITLATVILIFCVWLGLGYAASEEVFGEAAVLAATTLLLHVWRQGGWRASGREEFSGRHEKRWQALYWSWALVTTAAGAFLSPQVSRWWYETNHAWRWGWQIVPTKTALHWGVDFSTFGLGPAFTWLAVALLLAVAHLISEAACRTVESCRQEEAETVRHRRLRRGVIRDQLTSRYLAWGLIAAGVAGIWDLTFTLGRWAEQYREIGPKGSAGLMATLFTGLYLWLRDWLARPDKQKVDAGWFRQALEKGKNLVPMVLASGGALFLVIFALLLLREYGLAWDSSQPTRLPAPAHAFSAVVKSVCLTGALLLVALKFFDPAYFGLHDVYRSRVARAFLGAAFVKGPDWEANRRAAHKETRLLNDEVSHCRAEVQALEGRLTQHPALGQAVAEKKRLLQRLEDLRERRRAELQAVSPATRNRFTVERASDDLCLTSLPATQSHLPGVPPDLAGLRLRPVHLICCAANHLSGDALATLSRGARSAVLSQRGISIGNDSRVPRKQDPVLMLSAAQTASAAAFNSQMGERSILLGPAGSFLMSALNLRLGLWVLNPSNERIAADELLAATVERRRLHRIGQRSSARSVLSRHWQQVEQHLFQLRRRVFEGDWVRQLFTLPGTAFFCELFGQSKALPTDRARRLHLSDGGHFENLALYELIRRHTRYLIVSDAGQDEEVAFDDLGNAIRRVREDFGVEIEIDLDPLRPEAAGGSAQHLVVGTIHYDGFEGSDKGVLIYLKPTLTGDEPGDIQQYRKRNRIFPHEPTSDQFFSEAQWESYRRLGEHIGQVAFSFLDVMSEKQRGCPESVFRQARATWSTLPPEICAAWQRMVERFDGFDAEVSREGPAELRRELWPEAGGPASAGPVDDLALLPYLLRMVCLMEECWRELHLDQYRLHPAHVGIVNRFRRWWIVPSLRRWWVPLSPFCSDGFREFIKANFNLTARDAAVRTDDLHRPGPTLTLREIHDSGTIPQGFAWGMWPPPRRVLAQGETLFEYLLELEGPEPKRVLQVGVVILELKRDEGTGRLVARWDGVDFFVPDSMTGGGIKGRFLDRVIEELGRKRVDEIEVTLCDPFPGQRTLVSRQLRLETIGFYKSRDFATFPPADEKKFATMRRWLTDGAKRQPEMGT